MPTTLKTIRLSKHGLPAVLLTSEYQEGTKKEIRAYLVWPEQFGNHEPVSLLLKLSMPSWPGQNHDSDPVLGTMRTAALAGAIHYASKFCSTLDHPVDHVSVEELDPSTLRAWRSLGLYKGLKSEVFDWQTVNFLVDGLEHPYHFTRGE